MDDNSEGGLEEIVKGMNDSKLSFIKKIPYGLFSIFYGGVLKREYQKEFAEEIGWKEKYLTIANAVIFGLGSSALFCLGGDYIGDIGGLEYIQKLNNATVSFAADFIGITTKTFLYGYATIDGAQSLYRIGHAQITGKSIASFSLMGGAFNSSQYIISKLKSADENTE